MEGLPFLPGNTFNDPTKSNYHVSQSLGYRNGYAQVNRKTVGVGGDPIHHNQISQQELDELANYKPTLTYGQAKQAPPEDFIPGHVAFDKKVMRFYGFFKQTVHESADEYYRIRPIELYYYLEDDSICVMEPAVRNSGMPQGKLVRRQRLPKDDIGTTWHWKDLNNRVNVTVYGRVFRLIDCDKWTREFLESEGIEVNPPEEMPVDPYTDKRTQREELRTYKTPTDYDKYRQFLEMDRKVLRFFAVWDDRDNMFGDMRPFIIQYYLADDTTEVLEKHLQNDGRDPFPVLIRRHKVPKDRYNTKPSHPSIYLELTDKEVREFFEPKDFAIGRTVYIYGRRFMIYDCDDFTKAWYYQNFGITDFTPINVEERRKDPPKMEIPPYNGIGTLEDTLENCLHLVPEPHKKDYIKIMENDQVKLRYEAKLDSVKPEDKDRRFIITYHVADDMVSIYEPPVRNSGIGAGKFLEKARLAKPGSRADKPIYYGPQDFFIGAVIETFGNRFIVTGCDEFVLSYIAHHQDQFPDETIRSIADHLGAPREVSQGKLKRAPLTVKRRPGDMEGMIREVKSQLRKLHLISKRTVQELFLKLDRDRDGHIDANKLRDQLKLMNLPFDDDIVQAIVHDCTKNPEGQITLDEFRKFMENTSC